MKKTSIVPSVMFQFVKLICDAIIPRKTGLGLLAACKSFTTVFTAVDKELCKSLSCNSLSLSLKGNIILMVVISSYCFNW